LTVVGRGPSLESAADHAYEAAALIDYAGKGHRMDIGRPLQVAAA
jgi:phosphoribosylamine-glycine ligase